MSSQRDVLIRPARINDIGEMAKLLEQLFSLERDFTPNTEAQHAGLGQMLADAQNRLVLVAELDDEVIGMATLQVVISTAEGGYVGLVEDVVVDHDHHSKGVGRALMTTLMKWARKRGLSRLQLLADTANTRALQFYAAQGWRATDMTCLRLMTGDIDDISSGSRDAANFPTDRVDAVIPTRAVISNNETPTDRH